MVLQQRLAPQSETKLNLSIDNTTLRLQRKVAESNFPQLTIMTNAHVVD